MRRSSRAGSRATSTASTYRDGGGACAPGRQRPGPAGPGLQRPRGHAGLERLPPPRAVLRRSPAAAASCTRSTRGCCPTRWRGSPTMPRTRCCASTLTFLPLVKAIWRQCTTVKHWIALCEADALPADTGIEGLLSYEAWIGRESDAYDWPTFDEKSAATLCYTSGTTGNPEGRAVQPSLDRAARLGGGAARRARACRRATASCRWYRCSTSTPGASRTRRR